MGGNYTIKAGKCRSGSRQSTPVSQSSASNPQSDADQLEAAADQAIAACGGDAREAVKALIVANQFLETDLEETTGCGLDGVCARESAVSNATLEAFHSHGRWLTHRHRVSS
jgi:hypothetical protein